MKILNFLTSNPYHIFVFLIHATITNTKVNLHICLFLFLTFDSEKHAQNFSNNSKQQLELF